MPRRDTISYLMKIMKHRSSTYHQPPPNLGFLFPWGVYDPISYVYSRVVSIIKQKQERLVYWAAPVFCIFSHRLMASSLLASTISSWVSRIPSMPGRQLISAGLTIRACDRTVIDRHLGSKAAIIINPLRISRCQTYATVRYRTSQLIICAGI